MQGQIMQAVQIHTTSKSSRKAKALSPCLSGDDPDPLTVTRPGERALKTWNWCVEIFKKFYCFILRQGPWTPYAVKSDFDLIFLHLPHECWGGITVLRHQAWFMQVLRLEPRASWATCVCFDEDRLSFPLWAWCGWGRSCEHLWMCFACPG